MKVIDNRVVLEDDDFYNLDETLGNIIQDALTQFKERSGSYPSNFSRPTKESPNGTVSCDQAVSDWNKAIDDMIYGFDTSEEDSSLSINGIECPYDYSKPWFIDKIMVPQFKAGFNEADGEAYDAAKEIKESTEYRRKLRGRYLFAKYFTHLWE